MLDALAQRGFFSIKVAEEKEEEDDDNYDDDDDDDDSNNDDDGSFKIKRSCMSGIDLRR